MNDVEERLENVLDCGWWLLDSFLQHGVPEHRDVHGLLVEDLLGEKSK